MIRPCVHHEAAAPFGTIREKAHSGRSTNCPAPPTTPPRDLEPHSSPAMASPCEQPPVPQTNPWPVPAIAPIPALPAVAATRSRRLYARRHNATTVLLPLPSTPPRSAPSASAQTPRHAFACVPPGVSPKSLPRQHQRHCRRRRSLGPRHQRWHPAQGRRGEWAARQIAHAVWLLLLK